MRTMAPGSAATSVPTGRATLKPIDEQRRTLVGQGAAAVGSTPSPVQGASPRLGGPRPRGPTQRLVVPLLLQVCRELGLGVYSSLQIFQGSPPPTKEPLSFPEVMFQDETRDARAAAAEALGRLGEAAAQQAPAVAKAMKSYHRQVRCAAVEALGCLGPAALAQQDALSTALEDTMAALPVIDRVINTGLRLRT
eukprot:TRINITY_DN28139_c0_g3_i2.p1 TRINITY_DN28139_c0_g3~~TRINITY_DN28139_c0_g3_i2.p1  ORF type:complete len:194 (-),score=27.22 TRINITY_DN28139_c0_g3_i2:365-946(-)